MFRAPLNHRRLHERVPDSRHHRYLLNKQGMANDILCLQDNNSGGVTALEVYIMNKELLLELTDYCSAHR